jgi:hypothetical protein
MKFKTPGDQPLMIALTSGHTLVVEPTGSDVPVQFRKEAIARGCAPVGVGVEAPIPTNDEPKRVELIEAGVQKLLDSDDDSSFNADGKPNLKALSKIVGFNVQRDELDAVWDKLRPT